MIQRPCCKQSKGWRGEAPFNLSTFRNSFLLTHFLRQRFFSTPKKGLLFRGGKTSSGEIPSLFFVFFRTKAFIFLIINNCAELRNGKVYSFRLEVCRPQRRFLAGSFCIKGTPSGIFSAKLPLIRMAVNAREKNDLETIIGG